MAHALPAHLRESHLDTAFFANNALELHAFVFATQAFVILDRAKDTGAEQAITLRLESSVVDGLRFLDFTKRP